MSSLSYAGPTLADIAAGHAARGRHVFPVLPNSKRPLINDWPTLACADPAKVRSAWPARHNIGIACGPSRLLVIDLDVPAEPKPLPPPWDTEPGVIDGLDVWTVLCEQHDPDWKYKFFQTYTVGTPRGGLHLYFRNDGTATTAGQWRNTTGRLGPLVDTRGAGGYVLAGGSVVDGKTYDVRNDVHPPARPPGWLALLLTEKQAPDTPAAPPTPAALRQPDKYVDAAFRREITAVAGAWEGARNQQLNKSAFALARFVAAGQLDRDVAIGALTRAAAACGLGPTETANTIRSAFAARGVVA